MRPILANVAGKMETLKHYYDSLLAHPFTNGVLPHLLTVAGFLLAFFAIARLMSERRQPGNTFRGPDRLRQAPGMSHTRRCCAPPNFQPR